MKNREITYYPFIYSFFQNILKIIVKKKQNILGVSMIALFLLASCSPGSKGHDSSTRVIAYVRGENFSMKEKVPVTFLTHINYAFALIKDGVPYLPGKDDERNLYYLTSLSSANPGLKVLLSVGGWEGSRYFSDVALTDSSRRLFASRLAVLVSTYNLDGVDIDWEYPGQEGAGNIYRPADKYNFSLLLEAIRIALDRMSFLSRDGKPYLLSVAAGANRTWMDHVIMRDLIQLVDYFNLMTYDYHGEWEAVTGHHTNLYTPRCEPHGNSVNRSVKMFLDAGVPRDKIVIGAAFYGRWWKKVTPRNKGLCQESTGTRGEMPYYSIVDSLKNLPGFSLNWDRRARASWLWNPEEQMFVTFDDPRSVKEKAEYVRKKHLGGIMFWELLGDHDGDPLQAIVSTLNR